MNNRRSILIILFLLLITTVNFSQTTSGLIGYWPFNGNANDQSGNGNNGVVHNATLTTDRFGNLNGAYYFNGHSYIDCGINVPQVTNRLTISVWIKTSATSSNIVHVAGKYTGYPLYGGYNIYVVSSIFSFGYNGAHDNESIGFGSYPNTYNDNNWHHLVGVVNNPISAFWIDGVRILKYTNYIDFDMTQKTNFYIGGLFRNGIDQNKYYEGYIDDIRIYNRALDDLEIQALFDEKSNSCKSTVSANPSEGGTTSGNGLYSAGTNVLVIANPNTGYKFANWTENGTVVSTNSTYSFTITSDRNLVANFLPIKYTITVSSNPVAGGTTGGSGNYDFKTNVLVIASPNPGYSFSKWTEFGIEVSKSPYYTFTVNADRNVVANFATVPTLFVSPLYIDVVSSAGTGNFTVSNTTGGSMNWSAFSNSSWITITSGSSGTNGGTINFSYQANSGNYRVGTILISSNGAIGDPQTVEVRQSPFTSVDMLNSVPTNFMLYQNYPNPFNPTTRIQFGIPNESFASLKVYDVLGTEIISLVNQTLPAGTYSINFDASKLNNGIYFYRLQAGEFSQTKKMILLK